MSTSAEREDAIDALRGFALLGIAVVNLGAMANPFYGTGLADPAFDAPLDRAVHWFVRCVFETKFYLLFSFLFGYSFALQQDSARRAGHAFAARWPCVPHCPHCGRTTPPNWCTCCGP